MCMANSKIRVIEALTLDGSDDALGGLAVGRARTDPGRSAPTFVRRWRAIGMLDTRDLGAAAARRRLFQGPEEPEAATVPRQDRFGFDDHDGCPPSVPHAGHPDPQ